MKQNEEKKQSQPQQLQQVKRQNRKNMEMSWEFTPPLAKAEDSTLLTEIRYHNSHQPGVEAVDGDQRFRQRH